MAKKDVTEPMSASTDWRTSVNHPVFIGIGGLIHGADWSVMLCVA